MQDSPSLATPSDWNERFRVEVYAGKDGDQRFRVVSRANGQVVAVGEGYRRRKDLESTVKSLFPDAEIPKEVPKPVYQTEGLGPNDPFREGGPLFDPSRHTSGTTE